MTGVRRVLGRIALSWLVVHAGAIGLAPILTLVAHVEPLECTCSHGDHAICPMHHASRPGSNLCVMQSTDHSGLAALSSLSIGAGLPASVTPEPVPEARQLGSAPDVTATSLRPVPPDPPPPRA